jgi:hypothetical protein
MMNPIRFDFQLNCPVLSLTQNASIACVNRQVLQRKKRQKARGNPIAPMPKQVTRYRKKKNKNKACVRSKPKSLSKLLALNA